RITLEGDPDRPVRRRAHAIRAGVDALVFGRIDRVVRPDVILVALAVAVGVQNEGGPALGRRRVTGLEELPRIQPPDDLAAPAGPGGVVRVVTENHVVGTEAGIDVCELAGVRVVHGELAAR